MNCHNCSASNSDRAAKNRTQLQVSVTDLRTLLPPDVYEKSDVKGAGIFFSAFLLYILFFFCSFLTPNAIGRLAASMAAGLFTGILFIIGHDACHGILTFTQSLNQLLGRICFSPSLVPYSSWEYAHNRLHHGWTNVKGIDYAWCPLSLEEYRLLSPTRQLVERFYRKPIGLGWNYFFEIWWKHLAWPRSTDLIHLSRRTLAIDRVVILLFVALEIITVYYLHNATNFINSLFHALIIPHLVWNWLMAFVIYLQHTHPKTNWFSDPSDRSYLVSQIQNTVHVIFPRLIGLLFHNMMEHTVHHVDQRIPLYRLRLAQSAICERYEQHIIHFRFNFREFAQIVRTCQLYDYDRHKWLSFDA